jgi:UDP-N-acetylglucosamine acyltransferase
MISDRADIHPSAVIAEDVSIGPWVVIGEHVQIDSGTIIEPHAVIKGPTKIGKNNHIFQFASVGERTQDLKCTSKETTLEIGDNNIIREFTTLNRGTVYGGGRTRIGNNNLIMAYVHIAHDCIVGNNTIFANNASLAGHVIVEDFATLSGFCGVHQYCRVGAYSFIANATYVRKDILPFIMIAGYDAAAVGLNTVGLKRREFSREVIEWLRRAYKVIFRSRQTVEEALITLHEYARECPEVALLIEGLQNSTRGIVR